MICYIGVGSNLGERERNIEKAVDELGKIQDIEVKKMSKIYETEPVGEANQPKYLNGVLEIETLLEPMDLLRAIQGIENKLGRKRTVKCGPRVIDLDILTYGNEVINEPDLKIPHPLMNEREFVQKPLKDVRVYEGI